MKNTICSVVCTVSVRMRLMTVGRFKMRTSINLTLNEALKLVDNGITRFISDGNTYTMEWD